MELFVQPPPVSRFSLGIIALSPAARLTLNEVDVNAALARHALGYWGVVSQQEAASNDAAVLVCKGRVQSTCRTESGIRFHIVTNLGWNQTCILMGNEC
jgi:hypothetical protein